MNDKQKVDLCRLAIEDYQVGKLSSFSFFQVIAMTILEPKPLTPECIKWAQETIRGIEDRTA